MPLISGMTSTSGFILHDYWETFQETIQLSAEYPSLQVVWLQWCNSLQTSVLIFSSLFICLLSEMLEWELIPDEDDIWCRKPRRKVQWEFHQKEHAQDSATIKHYQHHLQYNDLIVETAVAFLRIPKLKNKERTEKKKGKHAKTLSHILSINLRHLFLEWFSAIEEPIWMKQKTKKTTKL